MRRLTLEFDVPIGPERVAFHVKPAAVSVTFDVYSVYTFEHTGRLHAAFEDGVHYRRGLDNRILARRGADARPRVGPEDGMMAGRASDDLIERIRRRVVSAGRALRGGKARVHRCEPTDAGEAVLEWFDRIEAWDGEALEADRKRFDEVYRPIGILPPDQYMALVIQATEGCPWNRCTFCDFYRDRPFRIRDPEELSAHITAVKGFVGEGLKLRRSIFLGDANALTVPWAHLEQTFKRVREAFAGDEEGPGGDRIYGFTDAFGAIHRSQHEIETLSAWGLRRVYIGLETGHDPLLELVGKQGTSRDAVAAVRRLKTGGVEVGAIVLLGLGGDRYGDAHVRDTVKALNAMGLGSGDMVYFSEMVAPPELEYAGQMAEMGIRPLTSCEMKAQMSAIREGLAFPDPGRRPKVAVYDIRRFVY